MSKADQNRIGGNGGAGSYELRHVRVPAGTGSGIALTVRHRVSGRDIHSYDITPSFEATIVLDSPLDVAALYVIAAKALREKCERGRYDAQHFIEWAQRIHDREHVESLAGERE